MPARTNEENLLESVTTLRDGAKDCVLDAAWVWKEHQGADWSARVLSGTLNVLAASEVILGEVMDHAPIDEGPDGEPDEPEGEPGEGADGEPDEGPDGKPGRRRRRREHAAGCAGPGRR